jgi:transcriptional regulator with XRE-family HTH domain
MEMFEHLPEMLRRLRREQQKTQKEVAKDSGCTNSQISRIESGKQAPTLDTLGKILQALGLTRGEFVRRYEEVEREVMRQKALESGGELPMPLLSDLGQHVPELLTSLPPELQGGQLDFEDHYVVIIPKRRRTD